MKEIIMEQKKQEMSIADVFESLNRTHRFDKWGCKINKYFYIANKQDCKSIMAIAVIKAFKSYNIEKGVPFEFYCYHAVKNSLVSYVIKENKLQQNQVLINDYDAIAEQKREPYINIPQKYFRVTKVLKKAYKRHTLKQACQELGLDYDKTYCSLNKYFKEKENN